MSLQLDSKNDSDAFYHFNFVDRLLRYSIFGQIPGMMPFPFFQVDQWPMGPYSTKPASLEAGKGEVPHKTFETFKSLQLWCPLFLGVVWKGQGVTWQCMKSWLIQLEIHFKNFSGGRFQCSLFFWRILGVGFSGILLKLKHISNNEMNINCKCPWRVGTHQMWIMFRIQIVKEECPQWWL